MLCTYVVLVPGETSDQIYLSAPPPAVMVPCGNDAVPGTALCALHTAVEPMTLAEVYEPFVTDPEPYEDGPTTL